MTTHKAAALALAALILYGVLLNLAVAAYFLFAAPQQQATAICAFACKGEKG